MKPKINPVWGVLTLVLVILTLALCILGANRGVLWVKTDADPRETAESFLEALVIGKYDAVNACLENYASIGLERSPRTEEGKLEWNALLASYDYTLVGEPERKGDLAEQKVLLRYLDLAALERALSPEPAATAEDGEAAEEAQAAEAEETAEAGPTLEELLAEPQNYYTTAEITLRLRYEDGQWRILADEALLSALSGGKA